MPRTPLSDVLLIILAKASILIAENATYLGFMSKYIRRANKRRSCSKEDISTSRNWQVAPFIRRVLGELTQRQLQRLLKKMTRNDILFLQKTLATFKTIRLRSGDGERVGQHNIK